MVIYLFLAIPEMCGKHLYCFSWFRSMMHSVKVSDGARSFMSGVCGFYSKVSLIALTLLLADEVKETSRS